MNRVIPRIAVVADLGRRTVAAVTDAAPLVLLGGLAPLLPGFPLGLSIVNYLLILGYLGYQWWAYATTGIGLGARLVGLRVISLDGGQPIGWGRFLLRQVILAVAWGTVIGGLVLVYFLMKHEHRQGWHDLLADSLVVEETRQAAGAGTSPRLTATPGIPPQLAAQFTPRWGSTEVAWAPSEPRRAQAPSLQPSPVWPSSGPQSLPSSLPVTQQSPTHQAPWQPPSMSAAGGYAPGEGALNPRNPAKAWIPLPTPTSVIEPSQPKNRSRDYSEAGDDETTRIAPESGAMRPNDEGWYLRLDDGREVELVVTVLLGRNPQKSLGDPAEVHLVPSSGDGRMISRTHVLIGVDRRGVYIVDRDSTNGTALVTQSGGLEPCPAGVSMRAVEGQQVSYGNRWFMVLRHAHADTR